MSSDKPRFTAMVSADYQAGYRKGAADCAGSVEKLDALERERDHFKSAWIAAGDIAQKAVEDMGRERIARKEAEARATAAEQERDSWRRVAERLEGEKQAAEQREAEKDKALREHRRIGAQLANVAYNWSQPACGVIQNEHNRDMLASLCEQWDALKVPALASPSTPSPDPEQRSALNQAFGEPVTPSPQAVETPKDER